MLCSCWSTIYMRCETLTKGFSNTQTLLYGLPAILQVESKGKWNKKKIRPLCGMCTIIGWWYTTPVK